MKKSATKRGMKGQLKINRVIIGGESDPKLRIIEEDWFIDIME